MKLSIFTVLILFSATLVAEESVPAFPRAKKNPNLEIVLKDIERALDPIKGYTLNIETANPWGIVHGVLALGGDLFLTGGEFENKKVRAITWLQRGAKYQGIPIFLKTSFGIQGQAFDTEHDFASDFEGHPHQFFGYLSDLELDPKIRWQAYNGKELETGFIGDMVTDAKAQVGVNPFPDDRYEMTWLLWGVARYLDPDAEWKNKIGETWTLERMVSFEMTQGVEGEEISCGGFHRLYAIELTLKRYQEKHGILPIDGTYNEAGKFIQKYVDTIQQTQNPDGSVSVEPYLYPEMAENWEDRVYATGHVLEFLMLALTGEQITQSWVLRAAQSLALDLSLRDEDIDLGPLFHATHALKLFQKRTSSSLLKRAE